MATKGSDQASFTRQGMWTSSFLKLPLLIKQGQSSLSSFQGLALQLHPEQLSPAEDSPNQLLLSVGLITHYTVSYTKDDWC